MKLIKKLSCLLLAITTVSSFTACGAKQFERVAGPTISNVLEKRTREVKQGDVFVSPDGNDKNSGTKKYPVKTPQKALELARKIKKSEKVIYFMRGEYNISSVTLTEEDSGITFYGEDGVAFNGGVTLNMSDFEPYKDNIKVLDLAKYGITKERIGEVKAFGKYNTAEKYGKESGLSCELFCDGERMTVSRYPNEGEYLKTGKIVDNGDSKEIYTRKGTEQVEGWADLKNPRGGTFKVDKETAERVKSWKNLNDVWLFGYFHYDWADSTTPLKEINGRKLTTEFASVYGFSKDKPYYFFNILEETDAEKEWYIDRNNIMLYFIPPADFKGETVSLSLEDDNLINIDGASNVTLDGITFTGTRANAVYGKGDDIKIQNCVIKNVGENAVELEGDRITVENNEITATGKCGVKLTGGDRETLRSSENKVVNNLIHDWSQVYRTYQAAVDLNGVGALCSHNEIYNSPHEAITYLGNGHIIEYNIIHDVVLESSDAGAIYSGRSWSNYGTVIRYNAVYNIGSGEFTPSGIYFDDALSGQEAYGNLLVNIPGFGFLIGGGRDIIVKNNMIVNAQTPIFYDDRAISAITGDNNWFGHSKTPEGTLWKSLKEVNINSPEWVKAYPELSKLSDNFEDTENPLFAANPANSKVQNNVIVNPKANIGEISEATDKYSDISENTLYKFTDNPFSSEGVYILNEAPANFVNLPLQKMGREYTLK